jgi:predicted Zn-dependent peptidase
LTTATLDNGLRVVVNPDPWVSGVAVNLWYDVGSFHEQAGKTGFAHLFEHLMFSGSAHVGPGEFDLGLQEIGGTSNASTSFDNTNYYEVVPAAGVELALWMEADRLSSLLEGVDQTNLDTQREVVKEEKRQRYDNVPYGDCFDRIMKLVFPAGHPYAHLPIGSMEDLDHASLDDVHQFFHHHYTPTNLILGLSGAIQPETAIGLVRRHFGDIPAGTTPTLPNTPMLAPMTDLRRETVESDVPQDVLYCCWLVPPNTDETTDPLGLDLAMLSGSMTSRLHEALVRPGLADTADAFDLGLSHGNSLVVASVACAESVSLATLEEATMQAWGDFCDQGPTEDELERVKKNEERDFLLDCATPKARAEHLCEACGLYGDPDELNRHLDIVDALDTTATAKVARQWLRPEQRATLTYRRQR